jgi:hypothetical protein
LAGSTVKPHLVVVRHQDRSDGIVVRREGVESGDAVEVQLQKDVQTLEKVGAGSFITAIF